MSVLKMADAIFVAGNGHTCMQSPLCSLALPSGLDSCVTGTYFA